MPPLYIFQSKKEVSCLFGSFFSLSFKKSVKNNEFFKKLAEINEKSELEKPNPLGQNIDLHFLTCF